MEKLLEYILWDYVIDLKLGTSLKFFLIYKLTNKESVILKEFIQETL